MELMVWLCLRRARMKISLKRCVSLILKWPSGQRTGALNPGVSPRQSAAALQNVLMQIYQRFPIGQPNLLYYSPPPLPPQSFSVLRTAQKAVWLSATNFQTLYAYIWLNIYVYTKLLRDRIRAVYVTSFAFNSPANFYGIE